MNKKISLLLFFFFLTYQFSFSQNIDSLRKELKKDYPIITKIHITNSIIEICKESEVSYFNEVLNGYLSKAKNSIHKDTFKDFKSTYYNNLGFISENNGDIKKALKYYSLSLKLAEKINSYGQIASSLQNLASLYDLMGDYPKALNYYYKSLAIKTKMNNKKGMANSLNSIAYVYTLLKNYDSTKINYLKSAEIFKSLNNVESYAIVLNNIGFVFMEQHQLDSAKFYFTKTLDLKQKNKDNDFLIYSYINLSEIEFLKKNYKEAQSLGEKAYELAKKHGYLVDKQNVSNLLHEIYFKNGNTEKAYLTLIQHFAWRDKITNDENKSEVIRQQLKYENDKKLAKLKQEKLVQKAITDEKASKQRFIIIFGIIGFMLVCIFSFFLYKRFRLIQKQNLQIEKQKEIIEEKQKEISDSINYAQRIQKSFLASEETFSSSFKEYFIYFNPKDIVSGDFYWANKIENQIYICVADSTGHGIPGAFMSLLNISLLNEALFSKEIKETNLLLDFVRKILILGLKQDETGTGGNDGMDCVFIKINLDTNKLTFSGANNPLWIVRENELINLKPDKMPVGRSPKKDIPFSVQEFQLQKGDSVYLFSDGFPDQFGGPKEKKFKYKAFEELLLKNVNSEMSSQKSEVEKVFLDWKGQIEQTDDVCVVGLKI